MSTTRSPAAVAIAMQCQIVLRIQYRGERALYLKEGANNLNQGEFLRFVEDDLRCLGFPHPWCKQPSHQSGDVKCGWLSLDTPQNAHAMRLRERILQAFSNVENRKYIPLLERKLIADLRLYDGNGEQMIRVPKNQMTNPTASNIGKASPPVKSTLKARMSASPVARPPYRRARSMCAKMSVIAAARSVKAIESLFDCRSSEFKLVLREGVFFFLSNACETNGQYIHQSVDAITAHHSQDAVNESRRPLQPSNNSARRTDTESTLTTLRSPPMRHDPAHGPERRHITMTSAHCGTILTNSTLVPLPAWTLLREISPSLPPSVPARLSEASSCFLDGSLSHSSFSSPSPPGPPLRRVATTRDSDQEYPAINVMSTELTLSGLAAAPSPVRGTSILESSCEESLPLFLPSASTSASSDYSKPFADQCNGRDPSPPAAPATATAAPSGFSESPVSVSENLPAASDDESKSPHLQGNAPIRESASAHTLTQSSAGSEVRESAPDLLDQLWRANAELQDEITALRTQLAQESGARYTAEMALRVEGERRIHAEDALEDIRRECREPFVVPALMDSFVKLAQLTGNVLFETGS
ncbi:uncharacterized protein LAESUDRAFT_761760 [Laetiporus sulphureus 93-53]|uniref:Uncharacterized protein n=1 Tax=Laetiporus sulphureus 93-53 TaxID=1314785 RepID=A0A165CXE0_9APHY|nr:uncharacterized protein LAESUDRAFT_761760 [Laetiporus sulphureus 93-53]KZT03664.1 hypothetical protein LAESUDRAFT_761760 [Laetiporus sulphureus 93-53]